MKKILILLALSASITPNLNAQENQTDFRTKCMMGIKGGANYSNVYDSHGDAFRTDPKLGFAAGAFLAIPIGRYLGIQPEILYSQKGFKATGNLLGSSYNLTRTSNYVDIPLLFAFKPSEFITVLAGPQYSYLVSQKNQFKNATTSIDQETEFDNDNVRKNTLCFTGGVDLTLKHIVLGARVGWDVQNNNGDGTSSTPRYKNMWYQATVGYRFYKQTRK
ncbi:MAG: porin family protein [Bacteroidia bacterium]